MSSRVKEGTAGAAAFVVVRFAFTAGAFGFLTPVLVFAAGLMARFVGARAGLEASGATAAGTVGLLVLSVFLGIIFKWAFWRLPGVLPVRGQEERTNFCIN